MLSCKDITEKADQYLEKDLPWSTRLSYRLHLFMCVNCRRYVEQIRLTISTLAGFPKETTTPDEQYLSNLKEIYKQQHNKK